MMQILKLWSLGMLKRLIIVWHPENPTFLGPICGDRKDKEQELHQV